jgi:RNA polymerase sigma-70 factor, ECF subfamily
MIDPKSCIKKSDSELVNLTLENQEYFICLMERYRSPLIRYIRRLSSLDYDPAEDVLQDVFIKVYQNLNDFDQSLKFSSWIYRITHNQVISNFRKLASRPEHINFDLDSNLLNNIVSELNIEAEANNKLNQEIIFKILNRIDIKYREVLILKFFEDKSYTEISDILKKPMGTVATLLNRAKKEFARELINSKIKI